MLAATFLALFQAAAAANAAPALTAPVLGYALNGTQLVQIVGIPGACYAILDTSGTRYSQLRSAVAARAYLVQPDSSSPALTYRNHHNTITVPLQEPALQIALSPAGTFFAAVSQSRISVFAKSRSITDTTDLSTIPLDASEITEIAISDYGEALIATANTLWYSPQPGAPFTAQPVGLSFLRYAPYNHLVVGYEATTGRLVALHPTASFAIEPLLTSQDLLTPLTGLAFSTDATTLWLTQENGPAMRYSLQTRQASSFTVPAGTLSSVIAPGVFLWSHTDTQRTILDTSQPVPTVLIVPDGRASVSQ